MVRPFLNSPDVIKPDGTVISGKSIWQKEPLYPLVNMLLVCGPWTLFGIRIQLDMGKNVAKDDYPRRAIVLSGWLELFATYFSGILPFIKDHVFGTNGAHVKTMIGVGRDIFMTSIGVLRNNILISKRIVGMLSSSFQPEDSS
jgi:hypothetical protein